MKTALLLVDIQNDYFPGGKNELFEANLCAEHAAQALALFRERELPIVHVQHVSLSEDAVFFLPDTEGVRIRERVRPLAGETVLVKHHPDSFLRTQLRKILTGLGAEQLVVCGMMSHMCIDTTVRAAKALGYAVILLGDACTTKDLLWKGERIPAQMVHSAFLAALHGSFATVIDTGELETVL